MTDQASSSGAAPSPMSVSSSPRADVALPGGDASSAAGSVPDPAGAARYQLRAVAPEELSRQPLAFRRREGLQSIEVRVAGVGYVSI